MIIRLLAEIGPWAWFVIGLLLLVAEVIVPGVWMIWFGLSALVIGTLTLLPFTDVSWWPWQAQVVAFGVLSFVFVMVGRKLLVSDTSNDDASRMNDPLGRFIGREVSLDDAIVDGVGKVKLGDTVWRVIGEDLPAGAKVRVTGNQDGALTVEGV